MYESNAERFENEFDEILDQMDREELIDMIKERMNEFDIKHFVEERFMEE